MKVKNRTYLFGCILLLTSVFIIAPYLHLYAPQRAYYIDIYNNTDYSLCWKILNSIIYGEKKTIISPHSAIELLVQDRGGPEEFFFWKILDYKGEENPLIVKFEREEYIRHPKITIMTDTQGEIICEVEID